MKGRDGNCAKTIPMDMSKTPMVSLVDSVSLSHKKPRMVAKTISRLMSKEASVGGNLR